ncbi:sporulation-specific protein 22 [Coniosporium tulheliwenetii]|uniref:Sporulation-specific protein 22 n=1 Tax=Coniosporium tulheliwenetii TaxID=3383036 RepID=A0ACC2ZPG5_9PEZI|nr:sporulation-specific protein 22 [Cladosporium sp. JES 115]
MAPPNAIRSEKEKKVRAVIAFAKSIPERLSHANGTDPTLLAELQSHINALPLTASKREELDAKGTELWNLSTRLKRDSDTTVPALLCALRVFSFLLLVSGQRGHGGTAQDCVRLLKVALKASKFCIQQGQLDLATKVLGRAAEYVDELAAHDLQEEDVEVQRRLKAEYYVLRTALAWKQSRLDLAEHLFSQAELADNRLGPSTAESLADILYEIGKDLLRKKQLESAVRWLGRSLDVLGEQDLEKLSPDAGELRLSIMHGLVKALLQQRDGAARKRAADLVGLLETDYGDKMAVALLKLDLLASEPEYEAADYYHVLLRMVRSLVLTSSNFRTILHHVHKLKSRSAVMAAKLMDDLLFRLLETEKQDWIEKAAVTCLWLRSSSPNTQNEETLASVQDTLDNLVHSIKRPLSAQATHAAQTLLWKRIEAAYTQEQYEVAESWCRLTIHGVFEKSGELNRSKIARKIILCALARQDLPTAREAFFQMSDAGKAAPMTRYLMYKVAMREGDTDFAAECLDLVSRHSSKDATLLYACVLEAQQHGNRRQAVLALQRVLDKYEYAAPQGVYLPALLRCAARLLMTEFVDNGMPENVGNEICKIFEGAATQASKSKRGASTSKSEDFTAAELDWFSRNSYNLSLKHCTELHPEHLARLLAACIQFIELRQKDSSATDDTNLDLRRALCNYLAACAHITLARAEDNIEASLNHYLSVRKHSQSFRASLPDLLKLDTNLAVSARDDLISKHLALLRFELEATLKLEAWDDMDALFDACWTYPDPRRLDTLADLVLVIHGAMTKAALDEGYRTKLLAVLQKIINLSLRSSGPNNASGKDSDSITKLARWLRVLFQLSLTSTDDDRTALRCLDQATTLATQRQASANPYPQEELEWLAATAFNKAVDFYCVDDDARCRLWAEKALNLAESAGVGER